MIAATHTHNDEYCAACDDKPCDQERHVSTAAPVTVEIDEAHHIELPEGVDPERALVTSSSQFAAHEVCERKWWFTWPMKLPVTKKDYFTFGTTLHAVLERFLRADDLGRDVETGQAVDLYPAGWADEITPTEADLIQKLVTKATEEGLIVRRQGRLVEHPFLYPLIDGAEGWKVFICGYLDYPIFPDGEVQDHKTTKDMKYAKSPAMLRNDTQMRIYAAEVLRQADKLGLVLDRVTVRHNVFCKDPEKPRIRATTAVITRQEIESTWLVIQAQAERMLSHKRRYTAPSDWSRLPGPTNPAKACSAYGGCPFIPICGGRESVAQYTTRVNSLNEEKESKANMTTTTAPVNPLLAKLAQARAAGANGAKAPAGAAAPPPINGPVPDEAPPTEQAMPILYWISSPDKKVTKKVPAEEIVAMLAADATVAGWKCVKNGDKVWSTVEALGFKAPEAAPPADDAPPAEDAPPVDEAPPEAPSAPTPPWAREGCTACTSTGFNKHSKPCPICDSMQKKEGKATSFDFDLTTAGDGTITWTPKPAAPAAPPAGTAPLQQPAKPVKKAASKVAAKAPDAPPADAPPGDGAASSDDAPPEGGEGTATQPTVKKKAGHPVVTFTMLINCSVQSKDVIDLSEVLKVYGQQLATASGVASYFDLDHFKRRDSLCAFAPQIAADIKGKWLVCNGGQGAPDFVALRDTLRGFATTVIEGAR